MATLTARTVTGGDIERLAEMIRDVEWRSAVAWARNSDRPDAAIPTGWPEVDASLVDSRKPAHADHARPSAPHRAAVIDGRQGGLTRGAIHEWFGVADDDSATKRGRWTPPLCILAHLAWQAVLADADNTDSSALDRRRVIVWVGRRCWPYPRLMVRPAADAAPHTKESTDTADAHPAWDQRLLDRSLLVDPPNDESRLEAMELALRSPAVAAVIADGSRMAMSATRRLHLAARRHGSPALLARPPWEQGELSAATSRWMVRLADRHAADHPSWQLELFRARSASSAAARSWLLEWNFAKSLVSLSSDVVDRSLPATAAAQASRRRAV